MLAVLQPGDEVVDEFLRIGARLACGGHRTIALEVSRSTLGRDRDRTEFRVMAQLFESRLRRRFQTLQQCNVLTFVHLGSEGLSPFALTYESPS